MSARHRDDLLADLADLCDEVRDAVRELDAGSFAADRDAIRAMERRLELIGEIATRLGDHAPEGDVDWADVRALRVLLAHVYHRVMPERLWVYATRDVPRIRAALEV